MAEGEPFALIEMLKNQGEFPGATEIITIDGLRVEYAGWLWTGTPVEHDTGGRVTLRS